MGMVLALLAASVIGALMGVIGAGGSLLAVPVFRYVMGIQPVQATGDSLFVVGLAALVASVSAIRRKEIDITEAMFFALPAVVGVVTARSLIVPSIPPLMTIDGLAITKDSMIMVFFGMLTFAASLAMIRTSKQQQVPEGSKKSFAQLAGMGLLVGVVTGFVGVGGGFLIVPALVTLSRVPIRRAIGTSLVIIAVNSLSGFGVEVLTRSDIAWPLILPFALVMVAFTFVGAHLGKNLDAQKLKTGFGYFVLVVGSYILVRELFF